MGKWTEHFTVEEFADKYGENKTKPIVAQRMEKIYNLLNNTVRGVSKVIPTSGYRGERETNDVDGAFIGDGHNCGIACDFIAYDASNVQYDSQTLAAIAEMVGFGGIAIIDETAVHVDCRDCCEYYDKRGNRLTHWRGDERTGNNYCGSFIRFAPAFKSIINPVESSDKHTIKIVIFFDEKEIDRREYNVL